MRAVTSAIRTRPGLYTAPCTTCKCIIKQTDYFQVLQHTDMFSGYMVIPQAGL